MEKSVSNINLDDTSPSQLHDVTEESNSSLSNTMGWLHTAPLTVKEYDEQLRSLKNENFNLKLRIYFLEEKMGINFTLNKDNIFKQNIDLQMQVSNLQKELQEKHDLLCQAVKAMELEDEQHRKSLQTKDDLINQYMQELDDLKNQIKIISEFHDISNKNDINNRYSTIDLQDKIKTLETELKVQKENNASFQSKMEQNDSFRVKYELLIKENQLKDERIKNMLLDIEKSTDKLVKANREIMQLEEKLEISTNECQKMSEKVEENNRVIDDMLTQINHLKRKYMCAKSDLENEQKKSARAQVLNDTKIANLEEQNIRQKQKIYDLQKKLEAAISDAKDSAMYKCGMKDGKTDVDSSVPPITSNASPKKDALALPLVKSPKNSSTSSLSPQQNSVKSDMILKDLEVLLNGSGDHGQKLYCELKTDLNRKNEKIIKLKAEQIKACEIIKQMIESRNKANEEIQYLKFKCTEFETELESVATKQEKSVQIDGNATANNMNEVEILDKLRSRFGRFHFPR